MNKYYDGTKLLSLKDINGNTPEIYLCTTNRSAGKTTYFSRLCVNKFLEKKEKFALLYRFNYELDSIADKFFKDINTLFFPDYAMRSEKRAQGIFHELYIGKSDCDNKKFGVPCGYAISINSCDQLKKYSHLFSDIQRILFDEFQSESGHYCNNEISKFISIHTTIARGQGKLNRYVPVYMLSNTVSLLNPYYVELGISNRIKENTKFLKGQGFVLEHGFSEIASKAQKTSGFNLAFSHTQYVAYSSENVYLNDNLAFIESLNGINKYMCTLIYRGKNFAIREFPKYGIIYCDDKPDMTALRKISVTTDDHQINYVMLRSNADLISLLQYYFEKGCFRFKNIVCKEAVLSALSYI